VVGQNEMTKITKVGRFLKVDSNGHLVNDCVAEVAPPWDACVSFFRESAETFFGSELDGLYLRGSVARGLAIDGISDFDVFVLLRSLKSVILRKAWRQTLEKEFRERFPFCAGLDVSILERDAVLHSPQGADYRFVIKTQALSFSGVDLSDAIPPFTPDLSIAFGCNCLKRDTDKFLSVFSAVEDASEKAKWCDWVMRKLLRVAGELAMLKTARYSRDLYFCWEAYNALNLMDPEDLNTALHLALNPSTDDDVVLPLVARLSQRFENEFDIACRSTTS
jgi:uncharacterized protein